MIFYSYPERFVESLGLNIAFSFVPYLEMSNNHPLSIWKCECTLLESAQTAQNIETQDRDSEKQDKLHTTTLHANEGN